MIAKLLYFFSGMQIRFAKFQLLCQIFSKHCYLGTNVHKQTIIAGDQRSPQS